MGGKNHQPCSKYLYNSTMLSLAMSQAGIAIETANVHLEQTLLAEMPGGPAKITEIGQVNFPDAIATTIEKMTTIGDRIGMLRAQMKELYYEDLPTITSDTLDDFGAKLASNGMVNQAAYQLILETHREGKFYAVLDLFDTKLKIALAAANTLAAKATVAMEAANSGRLTAELEENGDGNVRPQFAALYTAWGDFNDVFLASALLSTEAFYLAEGHGSLLSHAQELLQMTD
jgi:hypothetical protein